MIPLDRFNLDHSRLHYLTDDEFTEEDRKVNVFSINNQKYECPVDLRNKTVQVGFDRERRERYIVYFKNQRMGEASLLNPCFNAQRRKPEKIHD